MSADLDLLHLVSDRQLPKLHDAAKEVHESHYRHVMRIRWQNEHSTRFQRITGDPTLVCGYDGEQQRWLFAVMRKRTIVKQFGGGESRWVEEIPIVFWTVEDDSVNPPAFVDIRDPRLPAMIMRGDSWKHPTIVDDRYQAWLKHREMRRQARRRETKARMADLWRPYQRMCDELGIGSPHRGTAGDGVKIWSRPGERDKDPGRRKDGALAVPDGLQ